ncbi:MAG: UDP-N-acetylmuramate dehydrogenase [Eubacterium sp.]|uniref:UDP-N-acetylmuramate dehydrogenase n=1 Tax=Eubacterium sp. TaxID=142586 RepID=UPI0015AA63B0|nr:UDP-N-acetylmuramate dehydrogenase [Clostridiales bacterium]MEE0175621.1 UDP-N-acetylmuramate dehydrogenase [Eubacterium sp.]
MKDLVRFLENSNIKYLENEPMSNHTTFKIGGNAAVVVLPKSENEIASVIKECNRLGIRYMTVGNGSNLLVSDDGIDACVILLGKDFSDVTLIGDDTIFAQAGASLTKVCRTALENSLTGLEFAYGIPGSCGGGAFMNAGAYGGELKDVLVKCDHIDQNGEKGTLCGDGLKLSYRHSAYYDNGCTITGVYFKLKKGNPDEIKSKMQDLMGRRKSKQPLEFASAGSTFKRPEGYFAGALIEECNLKGTTIGGAQVSTKHAGFVINTGGATCNDVLALCKQVSDTVYKEKGVRLEMEVRVTK